MTQPIKYYIHTPDDLSLLLSCYKYRIFPFPGKIVLHLNLLSQSESEYWQRQLNQVYFDRHISSTIIYIIVVCILSLSLASILYIMGTVRHLGFITVISILCGISAGIIIDYLISKQRMRLLQAQLLKRIAYLESSRRVKQLYCQVN